MPLMFATFDNTLALEDRNGPNAAVGAGAVRYRDGYAAGTQAALVEEATTNLVPDPFFVNTTYGTFRATRAKDDVRTSDGERSIHYTQTENLTTSQYVEDRVADISGLTADDQIVTSFDVSHDLGSDLLAAGRVAWYDSGNVLIGFAHPLPVPVPAKTSDVPWTRVEHVFTVPATAVRGGFQMGKVGGSTGDEFWLARPQVEQDDSATSFTPERVSGTLQPGYAWTGTAHASASTRAVTTISMPMATAPASVATRYSEDGGATWLFGYLETLGPLGTYGSITHDGTNLVIGSSRALIIGPLMAFDAPLSAEDQATLDKTAIWTWELLLDRYILDLANSAGGYITGEAPNVPQVTAFIVSKGITVYDNNTIVQPERLGGTHEVEVLTEDRLNQDYWTYNYYNDPTWLSTEPPDGSDPTPETETYVLDIANTMVPFVVGDPVDVDLIMQYLMQSGFPAVSGEAEVDASGSTTGLITITNTYLDPQLDITTWGQYNAFLSVMNPDGSVVFGEDAQAGVMSTGIGRSAHALGDDAVAVGRQAQALVDMAVAIGFEAIAKSGIGPGIFEAAVALGWQSTASGDRSIAAGTGAVASGDRSAAFGYVAKALANRASVLGPGAESLAAFATVLGYIAKATANAESAVVAGNNAYADAIASVVLGRNAYVNRMGGVAIGDGARVDIPVGTLGDRGVAIGPSSVASHTVTTAVGYNAQAINDRATTMGYLSLASGNLSTAVGTGAAARSLRATGVGYLADARDTDATAIGAQSVADGLESTTLGAGAVVPQTSPRSIGIGKDAVVPANTPDRVKIRGNDVEFARSLGSGRTTLIMYDSAGGAHTYEPHTTGTLYVNGLLQPASRYYRFDRMDDLNVSTPNTRTFATASSVTRNISAGVYVAYLLCSAIIYRSVNSGEIWIRAQIGGATQDIPVYSGSVFDVSIPRRYEVMIKRTSAENGVISVGSTTAVAMSMGFRGGGTAGTTYITNVVITGQATVVQAGIND